jgi:hypothetical protein
MCKAKMLPRPLLCFLRKLRQSNLISLYSNRVNAWKARWDGQVAGTMPLPTDPDPAERLRYAKPLPHFPLPFSP